MIGIAYAGETLTEKKPINRINVLDFIISRGFVPFTTTDISEALECKEYQARAAVSWLKLGEYCVVYDAHPDRQHVNRYIWTGKVTPVGVCRQNPAEREAQRNAEKAGNMESAAVLLQQLLRRMK